MQYICEFCGSVLPTDKDTDSSLFFQAVVHTHKTYECPQYFADDESFRPEWVRGRLTSVMEN